MFRLAIYPDADRGFGSFVQKRQREIGHSTHDTNFSFPIDLEQVLKRVERARYMGQRNEKETGSSLRKVPLFPLVLSKGSNWLKVGRIQDLCVKVTL